VVGVELGGVDRGLEVEPEVDVVQERVQGPLVLLVAPGRAEREVRLAPPPGGPRARGKSWSPPT